MRADVGTIVFTFIKYVSKKGRLYGGGSDSFATQWVKNFTGEKPVLNQAFSNHLTALDGWDYGKEVNDINVKNSRTAA